MEGRTYRYFKGPGDPLYPFGYGMSYSKFAYKNLLVTPKTIKGSVNVSVSVDIFNVGLYGSDEV